MSKFGHMGQRTRISILVIVSLLLGAIFASRFLIRREKDRHSVPAESVPVRQDLSHPPVIVEVQTSNGGEFLDRQGKYYDWIEFWNDGEHAFDLQSWYLTDDPNDLKKWRIPKLVLLPNERQVVFASGNEKDGPRHADFQLSSSGEYLALVQPDGKTVAQEVTLLEHSYGRGISQGLTDEGFRPLVEPTPGKANSERATGQVEAVACNSDSQFLIGQLDVSLTCSTSDAEIWYSTDGTVPKPGEGMAYAEPIRIDRNTILRARAFHSSYIPSRVITRSFLDINELAVQSAPATYPPMWGKVPADYEMDRTLIQSHARRIRQALRALPIVSIVADTNRLFGVDSIYAHPMKREREIRGEITMFNLDGAVLWSMPCGLQMAGNETRMPVFRKHGLRVSFRKCFGKRELQYPLFSDAGINRFSSLMFRGVDDSWTSRHSKVRERAQYIRDQWVRDTEREMGRLACRGRFVHVCLNGLYWGIYNLVERPNAEYLAFQYPGTKEKDYIVLKSKGISLASSDRGSRMWARLLQLTENVSTDGVQWERLSNRLDLVDFVDYCILRLYSGDEDGGLINGANVFAFANDKSATPIRFLTWDSDSTFGSGWNNQSSDFFPVVGALDGANGFRDVFSRLLRWPEFRKLVVQRVSHWSQPESPLSPTNARDRYVILADQIEMGLWAESARWGDVHSSIPLTPDQHWTTQRDWVLQHWFENRWEVIDNGLRKVLERKE